MDGQVDARDLSVGWFSGIRATEVTYTDTEGDTSVSIEELTTHPRLGPMLRGNLALGRTVLESPRILLTIHERMLKERQDAPDREPERQRRDLPLSSLDLKVNGGNARIRLASNGDMQTVELRNIASTIDLNPRGRRSTFDVSMAVAENNGAESQVNAEGNVTRSEKQWTLKGTSGAFKVNIDKLDLSSLTPLFALAGKDIAATGQLNADAEIRIEQGRVEQVVAQADLRDFSQTVAGRKIVVDEPVTLDIDVTTPEETLQIRRFDVTSSFLTIRSSGTADTVDYDANADMGKLHEVASQFTDFGGYAFKGAAASKGRLKLDKNLIGLTGQGLAEQLVISKNGVATPATNANVGFNLQKTPEFLRISSIKILADLGRVELTDSVIPVEAQLAETRLNLTADVDLQKLQPFVRLVTNVPEGMTFAGRLTSETAVTGKNGVLHVLTDRTNVTDLVITSPEQEPFRQETVKVAVDVIADTREKEITINDMLIEGAQGQSLIQVMKGRFEQSERQGKTNVTGELEARYDLAAVTAMGAAFLPGGLAMEGIRTTQLTFNSEYPTGADKFLANLNGSTVLGFDRATYVGLHIGPAEMRFLADEGFVTIAVPPARVNDGRTQFAGNINLQETPMTLRMAAPTQLVENVNINDDMSRQLLVYVNPLFANQVDVTGVANFRCERLAVPLDSASMREDLHLTGTIQLDGVRLQPRGLLGQLVRSPTVLTILPTQFIVQDGFVSYKDMEARIGEYPVNFSGRVGLDRTIDMNVTFPWALTGRTVKVGDPAARVTAPIEGTLDNPTINIEKLVESLGKQLLEEELRKQEQELRNRLERIFR
ncbi:MAG: hypothetical protein IH624_09140 [Phycisphaerae bacterium]|nr:hypothetical protein [Phycisphaerae bacterium]